MSAPRTPGPWAYLDIGEIVSTDPVDGYPTDDVICVVAGPEHPNADGNLMAAAPDYATACGLDLHPGEAESCGPLSWFKSAIDALGEDAVREAAQGDDADAYFTMLTECRLLLEKLKAANAKARGEQ